MTRQKVLFRFSQQKSPSHPQLMPWAGISSPVGLALLLLLSGGMVALGNAAIALTPPVVEQRAQTPVNANVLYVNPSLGTDSPERSGSQTAPFRTITYAMQRANAGDVIQLEPGTYTRDSGETFPIRLKPGVILRGNEANKGQTTSIIGGDTYISPTFSRQSVTVLAEENSQIRGISITNPNTRGTGIWVEEGSPTIRNSTFSNSLRDGIFVSGTAAPTIENNVFFNNDGNGISVARSATGEIRGNVFQDTGFGIAVGGTSAPRIASNQIVQNTDGIVVSNSARPVLRNNVIENNTRDGIVAIADALPNLGTVDDPGENLIRNNTRYELYNATQNNTIPAVGNQIDPEGIVGEVDFVARDVDAPSTFPDVQGNWAQPYIEALAARDIIGGFPDGTYRPNDPVTRAQFAAIINKAFTPNPERTSTNFRDVSSTFWAYQAIQSAYQGGFLSGYPDNTFRPDQRIPRVQALVSLASGLDFMAGDPTVLNTYGDAAQIPDWAEGAIAAATQRNIVVNYPNVGQLNPNREATRAEIAAFVYQALVSAGAADPIDSPYLVRTGNQ